jgi:hypothetical protein
MSIMLKTTNPDAVDAMDPTHDRRVPYPGQILVYHMRPGEGRGGKITAPGIVTRVEDDDHVELMIIHAADDFITRWKIPRKTEQNPVNAWSFTEWDEKHYDRPVNVAITSEIVDKMIEDKAAPLHSKIASLEGELRRLRK